MKRNLLIIAVGLVVFVVVYAFFFPESQLPIHISTRVVWEGTWVKHNVMVLAGYPKTPELPEYLSWGEPQEREFYLLYGGAFILKLVHGCAKFDGKVWSYVENCDEYKDWNKVNEIQKDTFKPFKIPEKNYYICSIKKGEIGVAERRTDASSRFYWIKDEKSDGKELVESPFGEKPGARGCRIGDYDFVPTENGRIERIKDKVVTAILDRSNMGLQAVPSKLTTDDKDVFVLLESISKTFTPSFWVQVYDKSLNWKGDLVEARGDVKPVSLTYHAGMVLILWQDGVLTGHSPEGFEMFHKKIFKKIIGEYSEEPFDIIASGDTVYVLTETRLLAVNITQKNTKLEIWPRIADLGAVHGKKSFSITVKCDDLPGVSVKGKGLSLVTVAKDGEYAKIKLEVVTDGLAAFKQTSKEVIIESEGFHEVVPVTFTPFGEVRRFQILSDSAVDTNTGEIFPIKIDGDSLKIEGIDDAGGELLWNRLTSEAILLSPKPGQILYKIEK